MPVVLQDGAGRNDGVGRFQHVMKHAAIGAAEGNLFFHAPFLDELFDFALLQPQADGVGLHP